MDIHENRHKKTNHKKLKTQPNVLELRLFTHYECSTMNGLYYHCTGLGTRNESGASQSRAQNICLQNASRPIRLQEILGFWLLKNGDFS
jgi:hypothetical protein